MGTKLYQSVNIFRLYNIKPYKFLPRISVLLSGDTPSTMGPSIMAWNETSNNSHDDDDLTSHSLSLTSFLAKTGGRSCPCVADKSKTLNTGSSPSNNTSFDNNNNTTKFTSFDK